MIQQVRCDPSARIGVPGRVIVAARWRLVSRSSRTKGLKGEREVAERWTLAGFQVRGLESGGDHLCIRADGLTIASETKYAERWKVAEWWEQARTDAPQGTVPTLAMRRNRGEWLVLLRLDDLTALLSAARCPRCGLAYSEDNDAAHECPSGFLA